jgi:hypothetical protein
MFRKTAKVFELVGLILLMLIAAGLSSAQSRVIRGVVTVELCPNGAGTDGRKTNHATFWLNDLAKSQSRGIAPIKASTKVQGIAN